MDEADDAPARVAPFDAIGGEPVVRALVERFYALMDEQPEFYGIRKLHPADLAGSTEKLRLYLTGWLGGPPLYVRQYGHPRLRARHLPFPIGDDERDQWMACMTRAMDDVGLAPENAAALAKAFHGLADWMRNR